MIPDPAPALSVVATRTARPAGTWRHPGRSAGLGHTRDVSMIEGEVEVLEIDALPQKRGDRFVAHTGFDPRAPATPYRWSTGRSAVDAVVLVPSTTPAGTAIG
jgi:hypothetical protein